MKLKTRKRLIFFAIVIIAGLLAFNYFGPRMIVQINGGVFSLIRPVHKSKDMDSVAYGLATEKLNIKTQDGLSLSGYLVKSANDHQKGTVILVHGIRAYKEHFWPLAKQLADSSYNAVMIDLRAHGESEGKYCTFGYYEKKDIGNVVNLIAEREDLSQNIGIWGQSLGGAVAIQSLATNENLKFGIIESTFAEFHTIVHDYFNYHAGFDIPPVTEFLIRRAGTIAHFDPDDVKPKEYAELIHQPVLVVHGTLDKRINIHYGRENFYNMASKDKEFVEISNANHVNVWKKGGDLYFQKAFTFLDRQAEVYSNMMLQNSGDQ